MAVVLEGWCNLQRLSSNNVVYSGVTSFSGDYVSESLCLYIYSYNRDYVFKIQSYTNSVWSSRTTGVREALPHSYPLYLVRSSDFNDNNYNWYDYEESFEALALGKYICNIETFGDRYYWAPAATPLATPTGLYADNITSDSARVSWNAVENATDYKVEYRVQGATNWTED